MALRDRTRVHLEREEAGMIPAMRAQMRSSEMRRLERETMKHTSLRDFSLALPWSLASGNERERALPWAFIPWPVKLLYRYSWKARYERLRSPFAPPVR